MTKHRQQGSLLNERGNSREPWKRWAVFQKYPHNVSRIKLPAASQSLDFDSLTLQPDAIRPEYLQE